MAEKDNSISTPLSLIAFKETLQKEKAQILDTRLPDYFELGNIPGALNISLNLENKTIAKTLVATSAPILLICNPKEEAQAYATLKELGYTQVLGHLAGGMPTWLEANEKYDMVISISSEELALDSKHNPKAVIIDVRAKENFDTSHVFNAIHIPLSSFPNQYQELNKTDEILIYSNTGNTSMVAASYLKKAGFINVKNVWGGFERIKEETIDLVGSK